MIVEELIQKLKALPAKSDVRLSHQYGSSEITPRFNKFFVAIVNGQRYEFDEDDKFLSITHKDMTGRYMDLDDFEKTYGIWVDID